MVCALFFCCWSIPLSFPAGTDSLFFVLPKKSKQKKGA
ncbi:ion transporter, partial [Ralstonia pickettii]|nr:ion transporter [Ralstonia pickettii]MBA9875879.1 ion transporter [Ralstonia pickettii]MBA9881187.1 ion transporter [Ralstonia pickettii]MBA9962767.1 ion transporter [Ralstonia pickettii]MBB0023668.1 ion transporter [Ralstonia pickettii]